MVSNHVVREGNRPGDRSGFERDILFGLSRCGPCSGQDLRREINHLYSTPVTRGRLYPALNNLAQDGYVAIEQFDNRRCNRYLLTQDGQQLISTLAIMHAEIIDHAGGTSSVPDPSENNTGMSG